MVQLFIKEIQSTSTYTDERHPVQSKYVNIESKWFYITVAHVPYKQTFNLQEYFKDEYWITDDLIRFFLETKLSAANMVTLEA